MATVDYRALATAAGVSEATVRERLQDCPELLGHFTMPQLKALITGLKPLAGPEGRAVLGTGSLTGLKKAALVEKCLLLHALVLANNSASGNCSSGSDSSSSSSSSSSASSATSNGSHDVSAARAGGSGGAAAAQPDVIVIDDSDDDEPAPAPAPRQQPPPPAPSRSMPPAPPHSHAHAQSAAAAAAARMGMPRPPSSSSASSASNPFMRYLQGDAQAFAQALAASQAQAQAQMRPQNEALAQLRALQAAGGGLSESAANLLQQAQQQPASGFGMMGTGGFFQGGGAGGMMARPMFISGGTGAFGGMPRGPPFGGGGGGGANHKRPYPGGVGGGGASAAGVDSKKAKADSKGTGADGRAEVKKEKVVQRPLGTARELEHARRLQAATGLGIEESLTALRANNFDQEKAIAWVLEASNQNAWEMALVHQASVESEKENDAKRRMEALREEQLKTEGDVFGEDGFGQSTLLRGPSGGGSASVVAFLRAHCSGGSSNNKSSSSSSSSAAADAKDRGDAAPAGVDLEVQRRRELIVKMLIWEKRAVRWYKQDAIAYIRALAERLDAPAKAAQDNDPNSRLPLPLLEAEAQALEDAMTKYPEGNVGGVPQVFLQYSATNGLKLDADGLELLDSPAGGEGDGGIGGGMAEGKGERRKSGASSECIELLDDD